MKSLKLAVLFVLLGVVALWAGATFSRVKTWNNGDTLTAGDLNAEFNNILNELDPGGVDDYSATATAMQATADPYPGSVASLATSLQGELERLRYQLLGLNNALHSVTYWYEDAPTAGIFTINTTTQAIGINTTSPKYTLDVVAPAGTTMPFKVSTGTTNLFELTSASMTVSVSTSYFPNPIISPSAVTSWVLFSSTGGGITWDRLNVSSAARTGTGRISITFAHPYASEKSYACIGTALMTNGLYFAIISEDDSTIRTASKIHFQIAKQDTTLVDQSYINIMCVGRLAP